MIKCTTKPDKFKNLTLNKDYDATEDGEVYVVTNDAGLPARYAKKYFTTVVAAPPAPRSVPIAEALNVDTDDWEEDNSEIEAGLTIGRHRNVTVSLDINGTSVSCGVEELSGIAEVKHECTALYNRLDHVLYTGTKEDLFRKVITEILETIIDSVGACYIMSDAVRDGENGYNDILTEMSDVHYSGNNSNSGNDIILWVFGK